MARKNTLIKDFADYRVQQLNSGKFKFIRADASFVDEHTVEFSCSVRPVAEPESSQRLDTTTP